MNAVTILNTRQICDQVNAQLNRLMMLAQLVELTVHALPNSTDSDPAMALLTGVKEILNADSTRMHQFHETLEHMAVMPVALEEAA